jgi:limonene 1,2-monooxygenase
VHDWANRENTLRSWDLVARYVVPEVKGLLTAYRDSRRYVVEHRDSFQRANQAVLAKIKENERAAAALALTRNGRFAIPAHQAPDMDKVARERS